MKKVLFLILAAFLLQTPSSASIYIGTYKTETEYGLIDGFKFNFGKRKQGEQFIQLKSETKEEQERLERLKNKPKEEQNVYELFKFMERGTVPF